jgi:hypothetical protein
MFRILFQKKLEQNRIMFLTLVKRNGFRLDTIQSISIT